jgi:hypothetical protein
MNRIVSLLIFLVFGTGCASTNAEMLLRRVRENQRHIARLERALERATIIRETLGDEAPVSAPLRQVPVREDTRRGTPIGGMQRPFIARGPGFALPGVPPGLVATSSAVHIGTAPWRAQGEYGGEVAIELGVRRYSVGILVDRQRVPMMIGSQPSTLTIVNQQGQVVEEAPGITIRGAGPSTHIWAYFTSPNEAALVTFRCFQSRPGTGTFTEVARREDTVATGTTENFNIFDGACDLNRRH